MKKQLATAAVLAAAALTAGSAAAGPAAAASTPPTIDNCAGQAQAHPSGIVLFCGDAGQWLSHIRWSDWGAPTAAGTALEVTNTCTPDCAAGHTRSERVRVSVSHLRDGRYTRLTVGRRHFDLTAHGAVIA